MLILIGKNLKEIFKNKKRIGLIAFLPIVFFGLLALLYSDTSMNKRFINPVTIGIVDNDGSIFSRLLLDHYQKNTVFTDFISIYMGDEDAVINLFDTGELDATLIIPKDFAEKMMYMEHDPVLVSINTNDPVKAVVLKNILGSYEKYIQAVEYNVALLYDNMKALGFSSQEISVYNTEISYELIMTAMERNTFFDYKILMDVPSTSSFTYFLMSMVTLLVMYFGLYVGLDLIREKEQQTFQRLEAIGYSRGLLISSKLVSHVLYLFLIILMWFFLLSTATTFDFSIYLLIFILIGIIFSVSFSIFLACIFKSQEAVLLVGNIVNFISAIIGGSIIPLQFLPQSVQRFSVFTPNYWLIKGLLFVQENILSWIPLYIMASFVSLSLLLIILATWTIKYEIPN